MPTLSDSPPGRLERYPRVATDSTRQPLPTAGPEDRTGSTTTGPDRQHRTEQQRHPMGVHYRFITIVTFRNMLFGLSEAGRETARGMVPRAV